MEKALLSVSRVFGYLGALAIVVLMLAIAVDVVVRFITRASVPGLLEIAETSLVVSVFFGLAWTGVKGGHVDVDLVTSRLGERSARIVRQVIWLLTSGTLAWLAYASILRALQSTGSNETRFGLVQWPLAPTRWIIAVGLSLWLLVAITNVVRRFRGRVPWGEDSEAVADV